MILLKGFDSCHVYWDDEDSHNKNSHGGILPTGSFGRDTDIYYCCRYNVYTYIINERNPRHKPIKKSGGGGGQKVCFGVFFPEKHKPI